MKTFINYTNSASIQAHCKRTNITTILVVTFLVLFILFTLVYSPHYTFAQANTESNYNNNNTIIKDPNKEVPSVVVSFEEKEVEMDPFIHSQGNPSNIIKASQLNETQNKIWSVKQKYKQDRGVDADTDTKSLNKIIETQKKKATRAIQEYAL